MFTDIENFKDIKDYVITRIKEDIADAENYMDAVVKPAVRARYEAYYADEKYYAKKFPKLSKSSNLVDSTIFDTIEWAMPSLIRVFFANNDLVTITGITEEDDTGAEVMGELLKYQLERRANSFNVFYSWIKDSLIVGISFVKCYWEREEQAKQHDEVINFQLLQQMQADPNITIVSAEPFDEFGNFRVAYQTMFYAKNNPKIENVLISEVLWSSRAKNLAECNFVAHKKTVNVSYLRQKEKEGVYANVDEVVNNLQEKVQDDLEQFIREDYYPLGSGNDKASAEVILYECYKKIDLNGDGILEDWIITVCQDTILRIEPNYMGRHPLFSICPIPDPHRIFPKRSYSDLIVQLQDMKTALQRQLLLSISLSNDPRVIISEEAVNLNDFVEGRSVIRKKPGYPMADVVMPVPIQPLHPWTFQMLEYVQGAIENRTGITRYNQGLSADTLNKTAHGIQTIVNQSSQRLELLAREFAESGFKDLFRFMISLNQRFMDQPTVIRVANKPLMVRPDDIQGGMFDLQVNAGVGVASREANMQNLQLLMTALMQILGAGFMVATPTNIYNLAKRWMEEAGLKNTTEFLTDPAVIQEKLMMDMMLKQQVIASLPLELQQMYLQTGTLPPEIMMSLPIQVQALLQGGNSLGYLTQGQPPGQAQQQEPPGATPGGGSPQTASPGIGAGGFGGETTGLFNGLLGAVPKVDNRQPKTSAGQ